MCNVLPNRRMAFTLCLSVLVAGCGIKWATNKVLSNPDAIAKVGAVYDVLTPRDTTERLVFIPGDSIVVEKTDTIIIKGDVMSEIANKTDTIRIRTVRNIRTTDTIIRQMPPDNRHLARLNDTIALYKAKSNIYSGQVEIMYQQNKTAEKRLIWMAAGVLLLGVIVGVLLRFKIKL
jgi:hypothetical protein